jgi:hypothetical protein
MLNTEPKEEEIPITREDLSYETQEVLSLYDKLQAQWEGFSGQYLGKDLSLLPILFREYNTVDYIRRYAWEIIPYIDGLVAEDIAKKIKSKMKSSGDRVGQKSN